MSIKRRITMQLYNVRQNARCMALPTWVDGLAVRIFLVALIMICGSAYIYKTTSSVAVGYQMRTAQNATDAIEKEIQKMQVEIADNTSISNIRFRLAKTNMVSVSDIQYISSVVSVVAKR